MGQSGEIILWVNTPIIKEKISRNFLDKLSLKFWLRGVMHTSEYTAESNFSNFVIEYLGEIETEFENTLLCLSGAQMGSNHEKKLEVKNLVTHSL